MLIVIEDGPLNNLIGISNGFEGFDSPRSPQFGGFMGNKYWYTSYIRKRTNEITALRGVVLMNFHPLRAVKQWNEDDEFYSFVIVSFQEISKEEYYLFIEGEDE